MMSSRDLGYWLGQGESDPATGSPLGRGILLPLLCLALVTLLKRRFDWYSAIKVNIWSIVLLSYMFLSIFWSEGAPLTYFKRWFKEVTAMVMAFLILSEVEPRKALQSILTRSVYVLIPLSLILVLCFPEHGIESFGEGEMWVGVTGHKNALGRLCYISVFFLSWSLLTRRQEQCVPATRYKAYMDVVIVGMALFLMKGPGLMKSMSVASFAVLMVGLTMLCGLLFVKRFQHYLGLNVLRAAIVGIIVLGTAAVFIGGLVFGGEIVSTFGREETLTGRTAIWAQVLPFAMKEPIIGYGIGTFWATDAAKAAFYNLPHAHNGYLETILTYGFIGLFLVSMFLLSSCRKAHASMQFDYAWGSLWIGFLFMIVTHSIAEASTVSFTTLQMAIILCLTVSSSGHSKVRL